MIYRAVAVAVERQPRVVRASYRPRPPLGSIDAVEVEVNAVLRAGQAEAVAARVKQDGGATVLIAFTLTANPAAAGEAASSFQRRRAIAGDRGGSRRGRRPALRREGVIFGSLSSQSRPPQLVENHWSLSLSQYAAQTPRKNSGQVSWPPCPSGQVLLIWYISAHWPSRSSQPVTAVVLPSPQ